MSSQTMEQNMPKSFEQFIAENNLEALSFHGQRVEYRRYVNGGKW